MITYDSDGVMKSPFPAVPALAGVSIERIKFGATDESWEDGFFDPYAGVRNSDESNESDNDDSDNNDDDNGNDINNDNGTSPDSPNPDPTFKLLTISGLFVFISPRDGSRCSRLPSVEAALPHAILTKTTVTVKAKLAPFGDGKQGLR